MMLESFCASGSGDFSQYPGKYGYRIEERLCVSVVVETQLEVCVLIRVRVPTQMVLATSWDLRWGGHVASGERRLVGEVRTTGSAGKDGEANDATVVIDDVLFGLGGRGGFVVLGLLWRWVVNESPLCEDMVLAEEGVELLLAREGVETVLFTPVEEDDVPVRGQASAAQRSR